MSRKWVSVLLAFCMLVSMTVVSPVVTWAGALPESVTLVAYPERDYQFFERISTKASELNTSNKSVVSIKQVKQKDTSFGKYYLYLKAQKPGTAVVSVKLKGKTYKTKVTKTSHT
ncbi:MAG: hypothetical protein MR652_11875 [Blautia sp.]|uniref:hypothetical protein n=1 Tax=Blautia sp. TaxID=1955243 RepID=UPI0025BB8254|nr:hypothetical protein [Blautia sp.]MCI6303830.1 hypothetical protein [Blautia sp.]